MHRSYYRTNRESISEKRRVRNAELQTHRKRHLLVSYGLTLEEYETLLTQQQGLCAICRRPSPATDRGGRLAVDHDHKTGEVRGLLCTSCNTGLGAFREDPDLFMAAVQYLEDTWVAQCSFKETQR